MQNNKAIINVPARESDWTLLAIYIINIHLSAFRIRWISFIATFLRIRLWTHNINTTLPSYLQIYGFVVKSIRWRLLSRSLRTPKLSNISLRRISIKSEAIFREFSGDTQSMMKGRFSILYSLLAISAVAFWIIEVVQSTGKVASLQIIIDIISRLFRAYA